MLPRLAVPPEQRRQPCRSTVSQAALEQSQEQVRALEASQAAAPAGPQRSVGPLKFDGKAGHLLDLCSLLAREQEAFDPQPPFDPRLTPF